MQEKRLSIRVKVCLKVAYQVVKSFRRVISYTEDISEGGMRLPIIQRLDSGIALEGEVHLPSSRKPLIFKVKVVWLKETGRPQLPFMAGINFMDASSEFREEMRRYTLKRFQEEQVLNQ